MSEIEAVTALHTILKPKKIVRDEDKPEQQAKQQKPEAEPEPEPEQNDDDDDSQHIDEMV